MSSVTRSGKRPRRRDEVRWVRSVRRVEDLRPCRRVVQLVEDALGRDFLT
jgi:hypothetical protein